MIKFAIMFDVASWSECELKELIFVKMKFIVKKICSYPTGCKEDGIPRCLFTCHPKERNSTCGIFTYPWPIVLPTRENLLVLL